MPSAAATLLAQGQSSLLEVHGETMTWRSREGVVMSNNGEVVTDEAGKALETGDGDEIEFTGTFDDAYEGILPNGAGIGTTEITVSCALDALPVDDNGQTEVRRGDIIERAGVTHYVLRPEPDGMGGLALILSKQAH